MPVSPYPPVLLGPHALVLLKQRGGLFGLHPVGALNWFPAQLAQWCLTHQVTGAAITDGLIFMAVTMVLVRTLGLYTRATRLPAASIQARAVAA